MLCDAALPALPRPEHPSREPWGLSPCPRLVPAVSPLLRPVPVAASPCDRAGVSVTPSPLPPSPPLPREVMPLLPLGTRRRHRGDTARHPSKGLWGRGVSWSPTEMRAREGLPVSIWGVGARLEDRLGSPEWSRSPLPSLQNHAPSLCLNFLLALQGPPGADVLELDLFWGVLGLGLLGWAGGLVGWARMWLGWWSSGLGTGQAGGLQTRVQMACMHLVSFQTSIHPDWDPWLWCPSRPLSNLSCPRSSQVPWPRLLLTAERTRPKVSPKMTPNPPLTRNCIGQRFAMAKMKLLVALLWHRCWH